MYFVYTAVLRAVLPCAYDGSRSKILISRGTLQSRYSPGSARSYQVQSGPKHIEETHPKLKWAGALGQSLPCRILAGRGELAKLRSPSGQME